LLGLIPTQQDIEAFNQQEQDFKQKIDSLPSITVRLVNNTDMIASVDIESGLSGAPVPAFFSELSIFGQTSNDNTNLTTVDSQSVLIAAGGEVTGTIKCGELFTVSASAPFDKISFDGFRGKDFGLFVRSGNIQFSGLGTSGEDFEGDTVSTTRFIKPDQDGVNCESDTLVIQIDTVATDDVFDADTGELTQAKSPGTGTVSVEPAAPGNR